MKLRSLALAFSCVIASSQQPTTAVIGFLEDHSSPNDLGGPGLRAAFVRRGTDWVPAMADQAIQTPQVWRVLHRDKVIGTARTVGSANNGRYSASGLLPSKTSVPFAGMPSSLYGGWTGEERHRPMMAVLGPGQVGATTWKPTPPFPQDLQAIWPAFKQAVPNVPRCGDNGNWIDPEPPTAIEDVEIAKAYSDGRGQRLVCARLREDRLGPCDGLQDRPVSDFWFYIGQDGKAAQLPMPVGDDALTLAPLEFTEWDGETMAVFLCSGYDRDGYVLYYGGFQKSAQCFWSYH